jgi:YVTN family beta-propeller protein
MNFNLANFRHLIKFFWIYILIIVLAIGCKKDGPENSLIGKITIGGNGVLIANEGNFQFGNASLSYYNPSNDSIVKDVFQPANGRPLGDVLQSISIFNGKLYLVVNNSGKVEVINSKTFVSVATINGLTSPRYFLPVSNAKAYISDLTSGAISIVDLSTNFISGQIPCKGWTEEMVLVYGKVFATNRRSDKLFVISSQTDQITDSISVGYGANSIRQDKNGNLWVLTSGKTEENISAKLSCINPLSNKIEKSFTFKSSADEPWKLRINGTNDTLYFLNKGVFRCSILENELPITPFIPQDSKNFYGLGINPNSGELFVADAIDYVQKGKIYHYKPDGTFLGTFLGGIIPGDFYFLGY